MTRKQDPNIKKKRLKRLLRLTLKDRHTKVLPDVHRAWRTLKTPEHYRNIKKRQKRKRYTFNTCRHQRKGLRRKAPNPFNEKVIPKYRDRTVADYDTAVCIEDVPVPPNSIKRHRKLYPCTVFAYKFSPVKGPKLQSVVRRNRILDSEVTEIRDRKPPSTLFHEDEIRVWTEHFEGQTEDATNPIFVPKNIDPNYKGPKTHPVNKSIAFAKGRESTNLKRVLEVTKERFLQNPAKFNKLNKAKINVCLKPNPSRKIFSCRELACTCKNPDPTTCRYCLIPKRGDCKVGRTDRPALLSSFNSSKN